MSTQTQASKYNSPICAPAGLFYNHFPNTFLKLYGKIDKPVAEGKVLADTKPINCEWFGRPSIAISEMAESVCENVDVIERSLHESRTAEVVANLRDLADIMESNFMKYVLDDENGNKEAFFDQLEILGNAMYLTAIQFKMSTTIFPNLDWYTNMLNTCDGTDAELKRNPCNKCASF